MIYIVTPRSHRDTHFAIARECAFVRLMSYPALLARNRLPAGTYIFTDFDRLGFWQLELAARAYRGLKAAGCVVLNDPSLARQRLDLLRALHRHGVNSFKAWAASDFENVDRYPVFVRTARAHRGNLTDLIHNRAGLVSAIENLINRGYPRSDLIVVEYCAEPIKADIFKKLSVYRIGETLTSAPSVHERNWTAKYGENGIVGEAGYAEDLTIIRDNPHFPIIRRAFDIGAMEYGRADFGIVNGKVEVYEINTNPMMSSNITHDYPDRIEALRSCHVQYIRALQELEVNQRARSVRIDWPAAPRRRQLLRLVPGYQWMP